MASYSDDFVCSHCHRVSDETTCSDCKIPTRKRKGVPLVQDVLRWPSSSTNKAPKSTVPTQLKSLVKKCPHWEKEIVSLVQANKNFAHFSYREMEQEITGRAIIRSTWNNLKEKATHLISTIESRACKLEKTASCPLSEQKSFNSSVEHKAEEFRNLADKFLFGGEIYVRSRATKSNTDGVLAWKEKASRLRDVNFHEELVGYVNEINEFKLFVADELPEVKEFLNEKATIKRDYNLDLQAKGASGATRRKNAKNKRDDRISALSAKRRKLTFVPLVRKMIHFGEKVESEKDSDDSDVTDTREPVEELKLKVDSEELESDLNATPDTVHVDDLNSQVDSEQLESSDLNITPDTAVHVDDVNSQVDSEELHEESDLNVTPDTVHLDHLNSQGSVYEPLPEEPWGEEV